MYTEPKMNIPGYHIIKNVRSIAIYQKKLLKKYSKSESNF